jgi:hypothetical protein
MAKTEALSHAPFADNQAMEYAIEQSLKHMSPKTEFGTRTASC